MNKIQREKSWEEGRTNLLCKYLQLHYATTTSKTYNVTLIFSHKKSPIHTLIYSTSIVGMSANRCTTPIFKFKTIHISSYLSTSTFPSNSYTVNQLRIESDGFTKFYVAFHSIHNSETFHLKDQVSYLSYRSIALTSGCFNLRVFPYIHRNVHRCMMLI